MSTYNSVSRSSKDDAHNTNDGGERYELRNEGRTAQHITGYTLKGYVLVGDQVGHIYNGSFVRDDKAPLWVKIALSGKAQ